MPDHPPPDHPPTGHPPPEPDLTGDARELPPFAGQLRPENIVIRKDRVEAMLLVRPELLNRNGVLHGGAIMALADILGGSAAYANVAAGETTTTVESKTSFFRPVPAGSRLKAVTLPLHIGRRTSVWQTSLYLENGKLAALVQQTQMTIAPIGE
ncbi:PaaI family thioesterase [Pseudogemmobacter faecipullorum]|uniref:PaaI family thioesterase n=1 Tax=Pseudogemmobacter faecipullorum TaxID=2755041 RepID=A0ABS8CQ95_9RHOB|nr:PaaI family thioesterase [Pseudogemmobacter faecipullorum]MCB5411358.1 PaaI family thioesterase [Pseudogemmobacter faecipullorum]